MKSTITLTLHKDSVPVTADIFGQWALHYEYIGKDWETNEDRFCDEPGHKLWSITHAPSGRRAKNGFTRRKDARQVIDALLTFPQTFTKPDDLTHDELRELQVFVDQATYTPGLTWQRFKEGV